MTDGFDDDPFADDPFDDPFEGEPVPADTDTEALLRRAIDQVASARRVPVSSSVMIDRDELLDVLQSAIEQLPGELRQARWVLREQDELLAQRRREADSLLEDVRAQAERMVQKTEIVRQANHAAQRILDDAREEARRLRHEAEDYCDQKLASFEIVLSRTMKTVQAGRQRLQLAPAPVSMPGAAEGAEVDEAPFFDQDEG